MAVCGYGLADGGPPLGCGGHLGDSWEGRRGLPSPDRPPISPCPQKFLFFVLKSSDVLDILVPHILYFLNDARAAQGWGGLGFLWGAPRRGQLRSGLSCPLAARALCRDLPEGLLPHLHPKMGPCPGLPSCAAPPSGDPPRPRRSSRWA